jgi:hypothetical protein
MTKIQAFTSSGTFNVPAGVSLVLITMIGAGGGANSWPGNAGGAGEVCFRMPVNVTPSGTLAITVGEKGVGAIVAYTNTDGGYSGAGSFRTDGGKASFANGGNPSFPIGGPGGGVTGAEGRTFNQDGMLAPRTAGQPAIPINLGQMSSRWWGGGSGGGAGGAGNPAGNMGAAAVNNNAGGLNGGEGMGGAYYGAAGGASSMFGQGATGSAGGVGGDGNDATYAGTGGGGGTGVGGEGGDGADGLVWVEWQG